MLVYLLFAFMTAYVSAQQCPYGSGMCDYCPGLQPNPVSYSHVTGCTSSPCHIKQGENIHVKTIFTPPADSPTAPLKLVIRIGGKYVNGTDETPADGGDLCQHIAPKCPIKKGTKYTVEYDLPSNLPLGCGTIMDWVDNPEGQRIFCQVINVCIDP